MSDDNSSEERPLGWEDDAMAMAAEHIFKPGEFARITDLKIPLADMPVFARVFGRVVKVDGDKVLLIMPEQLGFGRIIEKDASLLVPTGRSEIPPGQLEKLIAQVVPELGGGQDEEPVPTDLFVDP